jgi:hypothetical protein
VGNVGFDVIAALPYQFDACRAWITSWHSLGFELIEERFDDEEFFRRAPYIQDKGDLPLCND